MGRKMVIRADDVGYTLVNNIGAFETLENGVCTAADVMLDCPGTEDALARLRAMPWISVGWHAHFWGSPVLPPERVPSLYDSATGHFRRDILRAEDLDHDELVSEMYAQMERCEHVLGRVPDTAGDFEPTTPFMRAQIEVCDALHIPHNFVTKENPDGMIYPDARYRGAGIFTLNARVAYADAMTDSIAAQEAEYDPYLYYAEDRGGIMRRYEEGYRVVTQSWHPGYVDYYMYQLGDQGPNRSKFTVIRAKDVEALTSGRMKAWIRENGIELVSFTDALYGTNHYQNHLRFAHSDLYLGNP